MKNKKIIVVGGGFRGIVIANKLSKNNQVELVEKLPYIGGVLFSEEWNGFYIDKGVHIFDNVNNEDTKLIQKILKNKFRKISVKYGSRISNITSKEVAVPDFTTLSNSIQNKITKELFECTYTSKKSKNLHEYLMNTYGQTAGKYFINLAKKYFAIDPKKLSPDAHKNNPLSRGRFFNDEITSFLKSLNEFDRKIALPVHNEPMQWHKDVSDQSYRYFYPQKRGLREFCDNALEYLQDKKVDVKTNLFVKGLKKKKNKIICSFSDGTEKEYDYLIWTIDPINLFKIITKKKEIKNSGVHRVPMIVFYYIVDIKNINDFTYIQDFTKDTIALRGAVTGMLGKQIINNQTYIDVEVPTKIGSKIWNNPEIYYERIWKDVVKMGLVKGKMPKKRKFVKAPVSFRTILTNYKSTNKIMEDKIKNYSNKIIVMEQANAQLFKILQALKTKPIK